MGDFSAKHYDILADLLGDVLNRSKTKARREAVEQVVDQLAAYFADDNPRFEIGRFKQACGFRKDGHDPVSATTPQAARRETELEQNSLSYSGPGETGIVLPSGVEILLTHNSNWPGVASVRARINGRCWWIVDVSQHGLALHASVPASVMSVERGTGYPQVTRR